MRKLLVFLLLVLAAAVPAAAAGAGGAETEKEEPDEWTVLFYFCGSDLESKYGYASGNLEEIKNVNYPDSMLPMYIYAEEGTGITVFDAFDPSEWAGKKEVNILVETGGSREWKEELAGNRISENALQRWRINKQSFWASTGDEGDIGPVAELLETCPLASMADPGTLTDFIRWGVQTCPAKKYALVLWDHGNGASTGMFIDELFSEDVMYVYELKQALEDSGVQLETLVIDACLMANIETAWAVKDSARWLVASEETVPGKGTAIEGWLQELLNNPECDGRQLGRTICDMTQIKYAKEEDEENQDILTWSVIDLSRLEELAEPLSAFFQEIRESLRNYPELMTRIAELFLNAEEYGDGRQEMRDLASVFYDRNAISLLDRDNRNRILQALSDIVVYTVHGAGRSSARGLSFCYPVGEDTRILDSYALNCPSAEYLAILDALTVWQAPDWVYEKTERLPEINTIPELRLTVRKAWNSAGFPAVFSRELDKLLGYELLYRLYYQDPQTEHRVFLGRTNCRATYKTDENGYELYANEPCIWPQIDGVPCSVDLLMEKYTQGYLVTMYGVPVQIGSQTCYLRCARYDPTSEDKERYYDVLGVWNTYDQNRQMADRNTVKIPEMAGQEYRLLWPIDEGGQRTAVQYTAAGPADRFQRALEMEEKPLPAGTYYLEYEINDLFMRSCMLDEIELHWDGTKVSFPEGFTWEGEIETDWTD